MAAAASLIAELRSHRSDKKQIQVFAERQDMLLVFEQHRTLQRNTLGKRVMSGGVKRTLLLLNSLCTQGQFCHTLRRASNAGGIELPVAHGRRGLPLLIGRAARHVQIAARLEGADPVVHRAPVRDDHSVKAPFFAQDIRQQLLAVGAVLAVDLVVGAHDGGGSPLLDRRFKAAEIDLPQRALVQNAVGIEALVFLAVAGKMLQAGADAAALHAADHGSRELAGQHGILGKVFEIPSAERISLDIRARAEQQPHAVGRSFLSDRPSDLLQQLRVPAAGAQNGCGKAGRGQRVIDVHLPRALRHFPQTMRAVAHAEDRHAGVRHRLGVPVVRAGTKRDLILKAHAFD